MADFTDLLDQLCVLGDFEPALLESDGAGNCLARIKVGDIQFFVADAQDSADEITVQCMFGKIARADESAVMRRLLETNLALVGNGRAGFGLAPDSGDVVYAFAASLADTDASGLLALLRNIADEASIWRHGHYLAGQTPARPPAAARPALRAR